MNNTETPSDVVAQRVRHLRKARGMTVAELADGCAAAGMDRLTAQALYKLETRRAAPSGFRRPVTVDEVGTLARALGCTPAELLPAEWGVIPAMDADTLAGVAEQMQAAASFLRWRAEHESEG